MEFATVLGMVSAVLTTGSFFPQVVKTWRSKSAADLSLPMCLMLALGILGWFVYGIMIGEWPVILANGVGLLTSFSMLFFKIRFG